MMGFLFLFCDCLVKHSNQDSEIASLLNIGGSNSLDRSTPSNTL